MTNKWNTFVSHYRSSHPGATIEQCSAAYRGGVEKTISKQSKERQYTQRGSDSIQTIDAGAFRDNKLTSVNPTSKREKKVTDQLTLIFTKVLTEKLKEVRRTHGSVFFITGRNAGIPVC